MSENRYVVPEGMLKAAVRELHYEAYRRGKKSVEVKTG